jgi:hypothetical protein
MFGQLIPVTQSATPPLPTKRAVTGSEGDFLVDNTYLLIAAAAILGLLAVSFSASRNSLRTCRKCKGTGKLRSWVIPWRFRPCTRCGRSGEVRGWGGRPLS